MAHLQLRLSRFKLAGPPTPRDTEASSAYTIIYDSLGPVCICSLIGINSDVHVRRDADKFCLIDQELLSRVVYAGLTRRFVLPVGHP
jgi:hypothetical protein